MDAHEARSKRDIAEVCCAPADLENDSVQHYSLLADAIYGLEDPFIATGVCENLISKNITIDYKRRDGQNATVVFPQAPATDLNINAPKESYKWTKEHLMNFKLNTSFSSFLDDCDPSPFGHGSQTVFDHTVRKALQIPGSRISRVSFNVEDEMILEEVQRKLLPLSEVPIEATLDKLNVYGEGGHFKAHRDTPRDEHCFGTLVVCLPSSFAGGHFEVWHGPRDESAVKMNWDKRVFPFKDGRESTYDLNYITGNSSSSSSYGTNKEAGIFRMMTGTPPLLVQWAAFFGDCEHEISKVNAGYRVTLTYILRYSREQTTKMPRTVAPASVSNETLPAVSSSASASSLLSPDSVTVSVSSPAPAVPAAVAATTLAAAIGTTAAHLPDYTKMKIAELKDLCRSRGLTVGGNKHELIERLQNAVHAPSAVKESVLKPYADDVAMGKGKHLYNTLLSALSDPEFMPSGGILGVPCFHLYERASDVPSFRDAVKEDIKGSDLRMKGADAFVYLTAAHLGLAPKVFTVMTDNCSDEEVALYPAWPSFKDAHALTFKARIEGSFYARALDLEKLQSDRGSLVIGGKEVSLQNMFEVIDWLIEFPSRRGSGSSDPFPARPTPIIECFTSSTGYFGNEAGDSTIYASAVIAIPVPAYEVRCKNPKLQQQQLQPSSSSAAASATSASTGMITTRVVGAAEDFKFFKGTKIPDALPRAEFARAQSRFEAFMNR